MFFNVVYNKTYLAQECLEQRRQIYRNNNKLLKKILNISLRLNKS